MRRESALNRSAAMAVVVIPALIGRFALPADGNFWFLRLLFFQFRKRPDILVRHAFKEARLLRFVHDSERHLCPAPVLFPFRFVFAAQNEKAAFQEHPAFSDEIALKAQIDEKFPSGTRSVFHFVQFVSARGLFKNIRRAIIAVPGKRPPRR